VPESAGVALASTVAVSQKSTIEATWYREGQQTVFADLGTVTSPGLQPSMVVQSFLHPKVGDIAVPADRRPPNCNK
jgi:hypothetical protein